LEENCDSDTYRSKDLTNDHGQGINIVAPHNVHLLPAVAVETVVRANIYSPPTKDNVSDVKVSHISTNESTLLPASKRFVTTGNVDFLPLEIGGTASSKGIVNVSSHQIDKKVVKVVLVSSSIKDEDETSGYSKVINPTNWARDSPGEVRVLPVWNNGMPSASSNTQPSEKVVPTEISSYQWTVDVTNVLPAPKGDGMPSIGLPTKENITSSNFPGSTSYNKGTHLANIHDSPDKENMLPVKRGRSPSPKVNIIPVKWAASSDKNNDSSTLINGASAYDHDSRAKGSSSSASVENNSAPKSSLKVVNTVFGNENGRPVMKNSSLVNGCAATAHESVVRDASVNECNVGRYGITFNQSPSHERIKNRYDQSSSPVRKIVGGAGRCYTPPTNTTEVMNNKIDGAIQTTTYLPGLVSANGIS